MRKLKFYTSLVFAKTAQTFLRLTKLSSGTAIIGKYVLKICPEFLRECNAYIDTKINVTGTNGKTTTSGIITHLINKSGKSTINNSMGANMLNGVVNTLATELNLKEKTDFAIIESDEAFLSKIYEKFNGDYLVVTNLFRDQLDRYGELETTKNFIQKGIDKIENLTLILNADDPLVANFEGGKNKIFYGVENVYYADETLKSSSFIEENFNCPCGNSLKYNKKFFAQQGHYYCDCGYKRPIPKYNADIMLYKDASEITLDGVKYKISLVGLYNAYNALAAITLCLELGIKDIEKNITNFKVAFGRSELKTLNGKKTLIQLIKNPVGATEVLKTVDLDSNILIAINDNYADGRDVSWLWDADFELLKNAKKEIVVSGIRAYDMALRLKYADVDKDKIKIIPDVKKAVDYIGKNADNNITILPTYTVLLKLNKMKGLKKCY